MSFLWSLKNLPKQNFVNNEYVDAKNDKKLTLHNPVDGSLIAGDIPLSGERDVDAAVTAAEKAFPAWKKVAPSERRAIMNKFAELVEQHSHAIAELTRVSLGAPYKAFGAFEIGLCAEVNNISQDDLMRLIYSSHRLSGTTQGGLINSAANLGHKKTVFSRLCAMSL
jgi:aldehyde dehydrogenase (NAD+)